MRTKVWIEVRRRFAVGDGGIALLSALEETGSIREAASRVQWSYRHALAYLDNMEEALGFQLLDRARGGHTRGGTRLTAKGWRFLQRYRLFREQAHAAVSRLAATVLAGTP